MPYTRHILWVMSILIVHTVESTNHCQNTEKSKWEEPFISRIFHIFKNAPYNELSTVRNNILIQFEFFQLPGFH